MKRMLGTILSAAAVGLVSSGASSADPIADFYKAKTITLYVGYAAGASYDNYARLIARHIEGHLPGAPTVIVKNMPGGSSLKAANYLYNAAPKDGLSLGVIRNGLALEQLYDRGGVKFDALKFNWIGSMAQIVGACVAWHTAPATTMDQAIGREMVVGALGSQGSIAVYPRALNEMLGTKFRIVLGYTNPGLVQALEQGEVQGRCGGDLISLKATRPHWFEKGEIRIMALMTNARPRGMEKEPWIFDYVKKPEDVQTLQLIFATQEWGQPLVAPPDVPIERVVALRRAFDAAMQDKKLLAEAEKSKLDVSGAMGGAEIQRKLEFYYKTPQAIVDRIAGYGKPGRDERTLTKQ